MAHVRCPLQEAALVSGKEPAIIQGEFSVTYGELDMMVSAAARRLTELGCRPGDRVAFFMRNEWRAPVLILALIRIKAVACLISTRLPAEGIRDSLERLACQTLVARIQGPGVAKLIDIQILNPDDLISETVPFEGVFKKQLIPLDQPVSIVFTSGSSTTPKGVLHTCGNHYYSARGSNIGLGLRSKNKWLLSLPIYHAGGLAILFRCLLSGAGMAIPASDESLLQAIQRHGISFMSVVSAQLQDLLKDDPDPEVFSGLKVVLAGGEQIPESLQLRAREKRLPLCPTYGLTETASQITSVTPSSSSSSWTTSGPVLPHREIRISDEGEVLVRGQTLFKGYVDGDDLLLPLDEDGWFHTGDLGELDTQGYLSIRGRVDNLIISGGENIQPEEIEHALRNLPGVEDAVVVPVENEKFGFRPVAFVKTESGPPDEIQLRESLSVGLPGFKIPDVFYPWPDEDPADEMKRDRDYFQMLATAAS